MNDYLSRFEEMLFEQKHLYLVGNFAAVSTIIEYQADLMLVDLIQANPIYGCAVIRYIPIQQRLDLIKSFIKDKYSDESEIFKRFDPIIQNAKDAIDLRNKYVHPLYIFDGEQKSYGQMLKKGKLDLPRENINIAQMKEDIISCIHYGEAMTTAVNDFPDVFPFFSSLNKQP